MCVTTAKDNVLAGETSQPWITSVEIGLVGKSSNAGFAYKVMGSITIKQNTLTGRTIGPGRQVGHIDIAIGAWEAFPVVGSIANAGCALACRTYCRWITSMKVGPGCESGEAGLTYRMVSSVAIAGDVLAGRTV